uniref:Uncharacterized protein n=1 Tax=Glossina palpalis gambiensis TaxID=67801 RepID=A0A1B0BCI0_9MUSC
MNLPQEIKSQYFNHNHFLNNHPAPMRHPMTLYWLCLPPLLFPASLYLWPQLDMLKIKQFDNSIGPPDLQNTYDILLELLRIIIKDLPMSLAVCSETLKHSPRHKKPLHFSGFSGFSVNDVCATFLKFSDDGKYLSKCRSIRPLKSDCSAIVNS